MLQNFRTEGREGEEGEQKDKAAGDGGKVEGDGGEVHLHTKIIHKDIGTRKKLKINS